MGNVVLMMSVPADGFIDLVGQRLGVVEGPQQVLAGAGAGQVDRSRGSKCTAIRFQFRMRPLPLRLLFPLLRRSIAGQVQTNIERLGHLLEASAKRRGHRGGLRDR